MHTQLTFKYVTGSGGSVTWASGDTGTKIVYATANDGTNPDIIDATSAFVTADFRNYKLYQIKL